VITQDASTRSAVSGAFAGFSGLYDRYTAHPDYAVWIRGLVELARAHGAPETGSALDLGCGTGNSTLPLLDLGYDVTGVDCVPEMLAHARAKTGGRARLLELDVADLPRLGAFDVVLCANDVLNYLLTPEELAAALAGAARNLAPGGVLVFDTNTLLTFRDTFATAHERPQGDLVFTWTGHAPADAGPGALAHADITAPGLDEPSVHVQRHHPHDEVVAALGAAGLRLAATYGQHGDGRREDVVDETRHHKAVHVATAAPTHTERR
jgi:SAM-dependent methyltransferase